MSLEAVQIGTNHEAAGNYELVSCKKFLAESLSDGRTFLDFTIRDSCLRFDRAFSKFVVYLLIVLAPGTPAWHTATEQGSAVPDRRPSPATRPASIGLTSPLALLYAAFCASIPSSLREGR